MELEKSFITWAETQVGKAASVEKVPFGDQNIVYKIQTSKEEYFLKIGRGLDKERERLEWLKDRQPVPKVIALTTVDTHDSLLLSAIPGVNLKSAAENLDIHAVIAILVDALQRFHRTDIQDCPFGIKTEGAVLVHGDACLPNFIVNDGVLSGYIDLEDTRMGDRNIDLAASVWSLQYNFGPGFGTLFLTTYGVENPTEEMAERLR